MLRHTAVTETYHSFDVREAETAAWDVRAGPRSDVAGDEGVFNIMVGTAITLAIAEGSKPDGTLAEVRYLDSWEQDLFRRGVKLAWLTAGAEQGDLTDWVDVERGPLEDFRPRPFSNGEWLSVREAFEFASSGLQTKRDRFIYALERETLKDRLTTFAGMPEAEARQAFHDTRDRSWKPAQDSLFDGRRTLSIREDDPRGTRLSGGKRRWRG